MNINHSSSAELIEFTPIHDVPIDHGKTPSKAKGLSTFYASLAVLSTIVGGGIVGIPLSFYSLGLPLGTLTSLLIAVSS